MAEITAAAVKALRDRTDLPMMECKKALVEADGDMEKAVEILKSQFKKILDKRSDNTTTEGRIVALIKEDGSEGVMIEMQCESAPVASNDGFQAFARACAQQLLEGPGADSPAELLEQSAPGGGKKLNDIYEDLVNRIREKIVLARLLRVPGPVGAYVHHDGKTGAMFQATGDNKTAPVLRDVAMHVAALKPTVVEKEQLDPAIVKQERDRLAAEAKATGKPDNIIEKIVDGRMNAFYVEQGVLVLQALATDETKTVGQALAESGLKAAGFTRWVLGTAQ